MLLTSAFSKDNSDLSLKEFNVFTRSYRVKLQGFLQNSLSASTLVMWLVAWLVHWVCCCVAPGGVVEVIDRLTGGSCRTVVSP